ncbi:NADH-ubiquinone oxidoreductase chain 1 [Bienertia sinuspersici]
MYCGRPTMVKAYSPKFSFQEEALRVVPLWVRLPNLPLTC